jgi:hypothetical protein
MLHVAHLSSALFFGFTHRVGYCPLSMYPPPARPCAVLCHVANEPIFFVPFAPCVYRAVCHLASSLQPCSKSQRVFGTCTPWASCTGTCVLPMCCWCHWSHYWCVPPMHRHSAQVWCMGQRVVGLLGCSSCPVIRVVVVFPW